METHTGSYEFPIESVMGVVAYIVPVEDEANSVETSLPIETSSSVIGGLISSVALEIALFFTIPIPLSATASRLYYLVIVTSP
jgi:hypothetical protein